ncbi:MAG: YraN family protein [Deltaproteobacteria bacterium]|nr:YraN family protein [Deltaproteobacteria bacterium]
MPSTRRLGERAEALAAVHLETQGYRILDRNFLARRGEIDLVAEEGDVLCLVEVRSRESADFGDPLETISREKRARLVRAARQLLAERGWLERAVRFDVVGIVYEPELRITVVKNAFDATGA